MHEDQFSQTLLKTFLTKVSTQSKCITKCCETKHSHPIVHKTKPSKIQELTCKQIQEMYDFDI